MKKILFSLVASLAALGLQAQSYYAGNGNTGWGGPVGGGTLGVSDNGSSITFNLQRGPGSLNDVLVVYIDTGAAGFADTSGFTDTGDGARKAISGFDGSSRSTMTFLSGFTPSYAIAIEGGYASVFSLVNGGSFNWIAGASQGGSGSANFTLSFDLSQIGLTPGAGQSIDLFGTYIANSGWRSQEAIAGNDSGSDGYNPFTQTAFVTYATTPVPEPSTLALCGLSGLAALFVIRRRR